MSISLRRVGMVIAAAAMTLAAGATAFGDDGSRVYMVRSSSSFRLACFEPCRCSLDWRDDLSGRFTLTRTTPGPTFDNFVVTSARLAAANLGWAYTGTGTYQRSTLAASTNRLQLDLTNGDFGEHFDSEQQFTQGSLTRWPVITITIDYNNMDCHDTVFGIVASRVGDWDVSGAASIGDVFAFLADYFGGDADADGDGVTGMGDVFAFLADYFDPQ